MTVEARSKRLSAAGARRTARLAAQCGAAAWMAFWLWFVIAVSVSSGPPPWPHFIGILAGVAAPPVASWWRPRVGGALFLIAGAAAAAYFPSMAALMLLALPAVLLGAVLWLTA